MPLATSPSSTFDVVLDGDRARLNEPPVFVFRPLTHKDFRELKDPGQNDRQFVDRLCKQLSSWRSWKHGETEIVYDPDTASDVIWKHFTHAELSELGIKVLASATLEARTLGESEPPQQ